MSALTDSGQDISRNGRQKAAILMVSLGPELSANVFKHLSDDEIEKLSLEIAGLRNVHPAERDAVWEEFHDLTLAREYLSSGGMAYAKEVLERALGAQHASELLRRLSQTLRTRPFDFMANADPTQIIAFLQSEHPQTIALILSHLDPKQSATILAGLSEERQVEVARRIALMEPIAPEIIQDVERVLEHKLSGLVNATKQASGGIEAVVEVLNRVDRSTEKAILQNLAQRDPSLAEEIKKRMFVFDDLASLDNQWVQRVLRDVDMTRDLPLALKVASDEVKAHVEANISQRAAENLKEAIEFLGPVRLRDVEAAQQRIVAVVRALEDAGEIIIQRGGGDEIVV